MLAHLSKHLVDNGLLDPLQSGYRPNRFTQTVLCSDDQGKVLVLALLDLSSASDTIHYEVLLKPLHHTQDTEGTALKWFH